MDPKDVARRIWIGGSVISFSHVCRLDPDYELHPVLEQRGSTGLLKIFELRSRVRGDPRFVGRWYESWKSLQNGAYSPSKEPNLLKVDILDVLENEEESFKAGKNGYAGHWAEPVEGRGRMFRLDIRTPTKRVCVGEMTFNFHLGTPGRELRVVRVGATALVRQPPSSPTQG